MLIDWFTVGAQALNFVVLIWLMKRFLYKPILSAIDAREKHIASDLAGAKKQKSEAKKEHDEFKKKNEDFDQSRAALLSKATEEAKAERARLIEEAGKAADALAAKRKKALKTDAASLGTSVRRMAGREVFEITRKAIADLSSSSLEQSIFDAFLRRMRALPSAAKNEFAEALKSGKDPAVFRSHGELSADQRSLAQKAVNETFGTESKLQFETEESLLGGMELTANGKKVAWSFSDYLGLMEEKLRATVQEPTQATP